MSEIKSSIYNYILLRSRYTYVHLSNYQPSLTLCILFASILPFTLIIITSVQICFLSHRILHCMRHLNENNYTEFSSKDMIIKKLWRKKSIFIIHPWGEYFHFFHVFNKEITVRIVSFVVHFIWAITKLEDTFNKKITVYN